MSNVIQRIESIRAKLDGLRRLALKETPTRTIVIDPILEALGWDIRDPSEVELEYPTVDGKSVDYALKINNRPVLLVEAKALDDPLNDVKAITQVVGYAANAGIVWCVLTNGVKWKIYRSVEKCPAPDKLMFEVSLDPRDSEGTALEQIAQQLARFSRDEMAKGTLDALGEQTFTDGKVRKALDAIMRDPPRPFLNMVRNATGDEGLSPKTVAESLVRIWAKMGMGTVGLARIRQATSAEFGTGGNRRSEGAVESSYKGRGRGGAAAYDESLHLSGIPKEVVEIFRALDSFCLSLNPGAVERRVLKLYFAYSCGRRTFCCVRVNRGSLILWLKLKYSRLEAPPPFARDVSSIGHWGTGDLELAINAQTQLDEAKALIRQSFESRI